MKSINITPQKNKNYAQSFRKSIFVVVYKFDKNSSAPIYLVLKRQLHWKGWEFTKGGIEEKEKEIDAAKREVKEETNLYPIKIKSFHLHGKYLYKKNIPDRPYKGQSYSLFSAQVKEGKTKIDKREHVAYKWLTYDKAIKKLSWSNQKKCLKIVHDSIINNNPKKELKSYKDR